MESLRTYFDTQRKMKEGTGRKKGTRPILLKNAFY